MPRRRCAPCSDRRRPLADEQQAENRRRGQQGPAQEADYRSRQPESPRIVRPQLPRKLPADFFLLLFLLPAVVFLDLRPGQHPAVARVGSGDAESVVAVAARFVPGIRRRLSPAAAALLDRPFVRWTVSSRGRAARGRSVVAARLSAADGRSVVSVRRVGHGDQPSTVKSKTASRFRWCGGIMMFSGTRGQKY